MCSASGAGLPSSVLEDRGCYLGFVHVFRRVVAAAGVGVLCAVFVDGGFAAAGASPAKASLLHSTQAGVSSNWAGYVASGGPALTIEPTTFSAVSATWREPRAECNPTVSTGPTSSAFWVGLGGDSNSSNALEQAGTEADCTFAGARYFAWYELVPAVSVRLSLNVAAGDKLSVSVAVSGRRVSITIRNLSRGTTFSKTVAMAAPDATSAEWIAEAPSVCLSASRCRQLSLTDFGVVKFSNAMARSGGRTGSISDSSWSATPVKLQAGDGRRGVFGGGRFAPDHSFGAASPSALTQSGTEFSVTWHQLSSTASTGYDAGYPGGAA
jgi:hypothetical protein